MSWGNSTSGTYDDVLATMEGWHAWLAQQDANASDETTRQHAWQLDKALEIVADEESEVPEGKHLSISVSGHWQDATATTPAMGYVNVGYAYVDAPVAADADATGG